MPSSLNLDYYYGGEAEQYSFYRIPKALFTDSHYEAMTMEARVLYGLLLDRMGLSARNGWLDDRGRVFIYFTLEDAMAMMGFGHNKAVRHFKELESIGLIERKSRARVNPHGFTSKTLSCCRIRSRLRRLRLPKTGSLHFPKRLSPALRLPHSGSLHFPAREVKTSPT